MEKVICAAVNPAKRERIPRGGKRWMRSSVAWSVIPEKSKWDAMRRVIQQALNDEYRIYG
jgi:hypothetical protein